jgi:hypothetical protein
MLKLVFQRSDRRLLGVHILGETAAEMVHTAFDGLGKVEPRVAPTTRGAQMGAVSGAPSRTKIVDR